MNKYKPTLYNQYISKSRYARYLDEESRRENWDETVDRYISFLFSHLLNNYNYKIPDDELEEIRQSILNFQVMPSMRALMTAGKAAERNNVAVFNCAYLPIDDIKAFDELALVLLNGTGVGFSVSAKNYVNQLPAVPDILFESDTTVVVSDSKNGWAKAIRQVIALLYSGEIPKWDISRVREKGARLKTFGGRASGPEPLVDSFKFIINIFKKAQGRKLSSLECHDICCKIADIIVVGGVRRCLPGSSLIQTETGFMRMDELRRGINVECLGRKERILNFGPSGIKNIYTLSHEGGQLRGSADHKVMCLEQEGSSPIFKKLSKIKKGEFVVIDNVGYAGVPVRVPFYKKDYSYEWTHRLFTLLGCIQGSGGLFRNTITFTIPTPLVGVSGINVLDYMEISKYTVHRPTGGPGKTTVKIFDKEFVKWYTKYMCDEGKNIIPDFIMLNTKSLRSSYEFGFRLSVRKRDKYLDIKTYKSIYSIMPYIKSLYLGLGHEVLIQSPYLIEVKYTSDADLYTSKVISVKKTGREMTYDIEVENINQFTAEGVVVHNSALISLSDLDDYSMATCKTGEWWKDNPQRRLANNSAIYNSKPDIGQFMKEWVNLYESKSGERGIFNIEAVQKQILKNGRREPIEDPGVNPCSEIILRPYQFCNLSTCIIRPEDNEKNIANKIRLATILGTYQSTFTDFKYLRSIWKKNTEEERLLGVSMTGVFDNKLLNNPDDESLPNRLENLKQVAIDTNAKYADLLGINRSVATTAIKPEGTTSSLCGTSSGLHPCYSKYYIRRAKSSANDPITKFMIDKGVPNEQCLMSNSDVIFSFPIKQDNEGVITRDNVDALYHLNLWLLYQRHYCEHKPSVTINVKEEEWMDVGAWVYKHFDEITGIAFLPYDNGVYPQTPFEECTKEQYEELLAKMPQSIDWNELIEEDDNVEGAQMLACSSGLCEI